MAQAGTYRFDSCGESTSGSPTVTVTGRELCPPCNDLLLGAAAGMMAGGGVPDAVATAGVFARLRRWRREGR